MQILCKKFCTSQLLCIFVKSYEQKYLNNMKVSQIIIEKLLNDKNFRLNTALSLNVTERNIQILAEKNSDNSNLTKAAAVKFYKSTGLKEKNIFENE